MAARRPRMDRNDLAFVVLSALGLGTKIGAWREARIRDFRHAARTLEPWAGELGAGGERKRRRWTG